MDEAQALRALLLFNEKADKLDTLSFTKKIFTEESGIRIKFRPEGFFVERYGPDDESIEAFVITMRFFIQKRDSSSFANLGKVYRFLEDSGYVDAEMAEEFRSLRGMVNELRNPDQSVHPILGAQHTPWQILAIFIYGSLAHADPDKAEVFQQWKRTPGIMPIVERWFIRFLVDLIRIIDAVRPLNDQAILALRKSTAG